jgi:hypothetical protein
MARPPTSDAAWVQALTEQRILLGDGCSVLVQQGFVLDDAKLVGTQRQPSKEEILSPRELLSSSSEISTSLNRIFKLRESCLSCKSSTFSLLFAHILRYEEMAA